MPSRDFPETVRQLVFEQIDSVEQLDVLLYMRAQRESPHTSANVSAALRSNPQSVTNRLVALESRGFLNHSGELFRYAPESEELDKTVAQLAEIYKVRPHKIFELIFSPLKKGRQFAEAFVVTAPKGPSGPPKKDSDNG